MFPYLLSYRFLIFSVFTTTVPTVIIVGLQLLFNLLDSRHVIVMFMLDVLGKRRPTITCSKSDVKKI